MFSQFKKMIKKALKSTPKERQLLCARSAVQHFPSSSVTNALKISTKGVSMQAVSSRDLTLGGRWTEIHVECYQSNNLEIGPPSNRQTRLNRLGIKRALRVPVCTVRMPAKRTSLPDTPSLHRPTFPTGIRSPRIVHRFV